MSTGTNSNAYAHLSTKTLQDAANSASVIIRGAMAIPVARVEFVPGDLVDIVPVALGELLQPAEVRLAA